MQPRWITAFVDQPSESFAAGTRFWAAVTGSTPSAPRGEREEFATLLLPAGDAVLRVQKTVDASAGVHVDFHVDSIPEAVDEARGLGARVLQDLGHVLMTSPAGLTFCFVDDGGERQIPPPVGSPASALDQICVDIPDGRFDEEVTFWRRLFGWEDRSVSRPEFHRLTVPAGLPFDLLFQRLGADSSASIASAHLDLAAGEDRVAVAEQHVALGATRLAVFERWIVMQDPVGLEYCVTGRDVGATRS